jgi:hypothetical protein
MDTTLAVVATREGRMGRRCIVCDHPHVADIEADMASGMGLLPLAARHGVSKSVMARHRTAHLAPKLAAAARLTAPVSVVQGERERAKALAAGAAPTGAEVLSLTGLLERVARSLERLDGAADRAVVDNLPTALAAVSGQLHRGIEAAARLQGIGAEPKQPGNTDKFSVTINLGGAKPLTIEGEARSLSAALPLGSATDDVDEDTSESEFAMELTFAP